MITESNDLVQVIDSGEHSTVLRIKANYEFPIAKNVQEDYQEYAAKILKDLSEEYTEFGIGSIIGALIHQYLIRNV